MDSIPEEWRNKSQGLKYPFWLSYNFPCQGMVLEIAHRTYRFQSCFLRRNLRMNTRCWTRSHQNHISNSWINWLGVHKNWGIVQSREAFLAPLKDTHIPCGWYHTGGSHPVLSFQRKCGLIQLPGSVSTGIISPLWTNISTVCHRKSYSVLN